jgi:hypothetical protein
VKGQRVRFSHRTKGMVTGVVIAESETCVGIRLDSAPEVPYIVQKALIGVVI